MSPVPGADLPLRVEDHALQIRHALKAEHHPLRAGEVVHHHILKVEQAIRRHNKSRSRSRSYSQSRSRSYSRSRSRDHSCLFCPNVEQDTPNLALKVEHLAQCQRLDTGKKCQMNQTLQ